MPSPLQPEFFALVGIDLFLAMSLLTCLLDRHFPWQLPYVYQLAALAGFGHLLVSREFMMTFGEYMRFWYSLLYLAVALANIVAVNIYLGMVKRLLSYAKVFMAAVTVPSLTLAALFLSNYAEIAVHPLLLCSTNGLGSHLRGHSSLRHVGGGVGHIRVLQTPMVVHSPRRRRSHNRIAAAYAAYKPSWGEAAFIASATSPSNSLRHSPSRKRLRPRKNMDRNPKRKKKTKRR
jgi:hypothetical protein